MRSLFTRLDRRYGPKIRGIERQHIAARKLNEEAARPAARIASLRTAVRSAGKRPGVAVVGGGFAGLMAARELTKNGDCDVTLFEARDRFGGRVWSKPRAGGIVEAGGELIGYNHPLWLSLAKEFQLGLSVITSDSNFDALDLDMPVYLDGKKRGPAALKHVYDEMAGIFNTMSRRAQAINPKKPWLAKGAKKLDARPLSDWIARLECSPLTRIAIEEQFSNDAGTPTCNQSYLANLTVVRGHALHKKQNAFFTQTETLRCAEGNAELAIQLEKAIRDQGGTTCRSTAVHGIRIEREGVTIELADKSLPFDYVVLAIPPSLWPREPRSPLKITPALSDDYYVSMGTAVKYLSPLTKRFWIGHGLAPIAISTLFGVTWESTDNQIDAPGSDVQLSLFAGGGVAQDALAAYRSGGKPKLDQYYRERIGAVYPDYDKFLARDPDFIAWPDDEWTRAGYSCPAPGEICLAGPLLDKPYEKRMFFAGEHTCFAYFGYMEGALQSGQKAAADIIKTIATA